MKPRSGSVMGLAVVLVTCCAFAASRQTVPSTNPGGNGGHLGIAIGSLTPSEKQSFGTDGVLVKQLEPDGPAARAGVRVHDVIVAIDSARISNKDDLLAVVSRLIPGSTARLQILRAGNLITIRVPVAAAADPSRQTANVANSSTTEDRGTSTGSAPPEKQAQAGSSAGGQNAWAPDSQVGDLQFNVPSGWKKVQTANETVLTPKGLSRNAVVIIGILPAQNSSDPHAWFRATWANWKSKINLIDPGDPETTHHANGFKVLRSYSRAYSSRLGNSVFILGAAVSGNRVAPYYYLCNTNCDVDGYENALQNFELSLSLASLGRARTNTEEAGSSGGLKGLYTSFNMSEGDAALGTFRVRGSVAYLGFFPDGNVIRTLPKEGLENFDFRAAVRNSRESCGRYQVVGNRITIKWGDNSTVSGVRDGAKLHFGDDAFEYEPVAHSDGLTLQANYHPERTDPRARIVFTQDGRFADNDALRAVGVPASSGSGSYRIKDNTLTLTFSDGRIVKVSFFVFADEQGSQRPGTIHLNGHALLRVH